jgi:SAM-dependent methyltransferase
MTEILEKYDAVAERYSNHEYADAGRYYARRARLVVEHGPRLRRGASVLDIACGDGGLGRALLALGIEYHGVDASARMVEVAGRTLAGRVTPGSFDFEPFEPVDATTIFRALYLVPDRRAFFGHVRGYTRHKLVFDFDPRAYDRDAVVEDLREAGWTRIALRPFFMPQRVALPRIVQRSLYALEPVPGARALTRIRFPLLVSASR